MALYDSLPMWLTRWIRGIWYSGYDRHGNAKYLLGRAADPTRCDVAGVPSEVRDEALKLLCDAFDIPDRQMHCLLPGDELMAIYKSFVGPRPWDDLEFERLMLALGELPGGEVPPHQFEAIRCVEDLIRFVAARRGIVAMDS